MKNQSIFIIILLLFFHGPTWGISFFKRSNNLCSSIFKMSINLTDRISLDINFEDQLQQIREIKRSWYKSISLSNKVDPEIERFISQSVNEAFPLSLNDRFSFNLEVKEKTLNRYLYEKILRYGFEEAILNTESTDPYKYQIKYAFQKILKRIFHREREFVSVIKVSWLDKGLEGLTDEQLKYLKTKKILTQFTSAFKNAIFIYFISTAIIQWNEETIRHETQQKEQASQFGSKISNSADKILQVNAKRAFNDLIKRHTEYFGTPPEASEVETYRKQVKMVYKIGQI